MYIHTYVHVVFDTLCAGYVLYICTSLSTRTYIVCVLCLCAVSHAAHGGE